MSLLDEAMETCVFLNKQRVDDGYGGYTTIWTEGAEFKAAIVFDTSIEARLAQVQGVYSLYTVTTQRDLTLEYGEVFRRKRDSKIFKVYMNLKSFLTRMILCLSTMPSDLWFQRRLYQTAS